MDKTKIPFPIPDIGVNLESQDQFVQNRGVHFEHYAALPSPIGLKDRGDYRRSDLYDSVSSNGMIYKKAGCFIGVITSNSKRKTQSDGGIVDYSTARLSLPRFYEDGSEIHLAPGDRVFIKDLEVLVPNYQRVEHNPGGLDRAQFPIKCVDHLMDSRGIEYKQGVHFKLKDGQIQWIDGKDNPGTDPDTGNGRIYSIRYKYNAHWYITEIPNEVRVAQSFDENGEKVAQRMPYSAIIQREYVYYNQNNDVDKDTGRQKEVRNIERPKEPVKVVDEYQVKVDMTDVNGTDNLDDIEQ
jgi:hypothetical protein